MYILRAVLTWVDDESYRNAKQMIQSNSLGEIHAIETTCLDQQDPTGKYPTSSTRSIA